MVTFKITNRQIAEPDFAAGTPGTELVYPQSIISDYWFAQYDVGGTSYVWRCYDGSDIIPWETCLELTNCGSNGIGLQIYGAFPDFIIYVCWTGGNNVVYYKYSEDFGTNWSNVGDGSMTLTAGYVLHVVDLFVGGALENTLNYRLYDTTNDYELWYSANADVPGEPGYVGYTSACGGRPPAGCYVDGNYYFARLNHLGDCYLYYQALGPGSGTTIAKLVDPSGSDYTDVSDYSPVLTNGRRIWCCCYLTDTWYTLYVQSTSQRAAGTTYKGPTYYYNSPVVVYSDRYICPRHCTTTENTSNNENMSFPYGHTTLCLQMGDYIGSYDDSTDNIYLIDSLAAYTNDVAVLGGQILKYDLSGDTTWYTIDVAPEAVSVISCVADLDTITITADVNLIRTFRSRALDCVCITSASSYTIPGIIKSIEQNGSRQTIKCTAFTSELRTAMTIYLEDAVTKSTLLDSTLRQCFYSYKYTNPDFNDGATVLAYPDQITASPMQVIEFLSILDGCYYSIHPNSTITLDKDEIDTGLELTESTVFSTLRDGEDYRAYSRLILTSYTISGYKLESVGTISNNNISSNIYRAELALANTQDHLDDCRDTISSRLAATSQFATIKIALTALGGATLVAIGEHIANSLTDTTLRPYLGQGNDLFVTDYSVDLVTSTWEISLVTAYLVPSPIQAVAVNQTSQSLQTVFDSSWKYVWRDAPLNNDIIITLANASFSTEINPMTADDNNTTGGATLTNNLVANGVLPAGTKAVQIMMLIKNTTADAGNYCYAQMVGETAYPVFQYGASVANYINGINGPVKLDANGYFKIGGTRVAGTLTVYVRIIGYYI